MKIGKMRTIAQFQERVNQQNPNTGSYEPVWTTYEEAFVDLQGTQGREDLEGTNKLNAEVTHKIWVRNHTGFDPQPQDRIVSKGRIFEIVYSINLEEKDRYFLIGAFEDLNQ